MQVGQELHILPFSGLIHEVRPGDTVASVANGYQALVQDVVSANKLAQPYIIVVGHKLAVPGGYRPLPKRVVVAPSLAPDTVRSPEDDEQVAAVIAAPPRRTFPTLGGTPQEQFIASIGEAAVNRPTRRAPGQCHDRPGNSGKLLGFESACAARRTTTSASKHRPGAARRARSGSTCGK